MAAIVYSICIIIGLVLNLPLSKVFSLGVFLLITTGLSVWILVFILEYYSNNKDKLKDDNDIIDKNQENLTTEQDNLDNGEGLNKKSSVDKNNLEDFSPLTPPILEMDQEIGDISE